MLKKTHTHKHTKKPKFSSVLLWEKVEETEECEARDMEDPAWRSRRLWGEACEVSTGEVEGQEGFSHYAPVIGCHADYYLLVGSFVFTVDRSSKVPLTIERERACTVNRKHVMGKHIHLILQIILTSLRMYPTLPSKRSSPSLAVHGKHQS